MSLDYRIMTWKGASLFETPHFMKTEAWREEGACSRKPHSQRQKCGCKPHFQPRFLHSLTKDFKAIPFPIVLFPSLWVGNVAKLGELTL